jgi:hypothetical protein
MVKYDYISDLHIDHWDEKYYNKNTRGEVKHYPFIKDKPNSDILIIAGDISDDLDISINYIKEIKTHYKIILFVDGNHEHINKFPNLYNTNEINEKLKMDDTIYYLPNRDFIKNETVFIGYCGWWDFNNKEDIDNYLTTRLNKKDALLLNKNILLRANEEFELLNNKLKKYENDENIKNIIIVSHTVALPRFARYRATDFNSKFIAFNIGNYKKIKNWIFGHSHEGFKFTSCGVKYLSNPRGRPSDYDREFYNIKTNY